MIAATVQACATVAAVAMAAAPAPVVCVLDGPDVEPMRESLRRLGCPYADVARLGPKAIARYRVWVLAGTRPPVDTQGATAVRGFLNAGGSVLAVGGGVTALIEHGLVDARGYFLCGTTMHMTAFHAYHRLTFGYPGAKPFKAWMAGVTNLLRATQGPLMELGPKATSILGLDGTGLYSAAALQPVGKGIILAIGPDPQGGKVYYELGRAKLQGGDKLGTERLLANAIAFLTDRCCNLVPNAGFEQNTTLPPQQSNWQTAGHHGATVTWCKSGAPEGHVFLKIHCPAKRSLATVQPYCPLAVERGRTYRFSCTYRCTAEWRILLTAYRGTPPGLKAKPGGSTRVPASREWRRVETTFPVPADVSYVRPIVRVERQGQLDIDAIHFGLAPPRPKPATRPSP